MKRSEVALMLVALAVVIAAGALAVVGAGQSIDLQEAPHKVLAPDEEIFCSYATRTGSVDLLSDLQQPSTGTLRHSLLVFADKTAGRAPRSIRHDAGVVAGAAHATKPGRPPSAAAQAAAGRVDAYAVAHC